MLQPPRKKTGPQTRCDRKKSQQTSGRLGSLPEVDIQVTCGVYLFLRLASRLRLLKKPVRKLDEKRPVRACRVSAGMLPERDFAVGQSCFLRRKFAGSKVLLTQKSVHRTRGGGRHERSLRVHPLPLHGRRPDADEHRPRRA
jgi:hypothetical protein